MIITHILTKDKNIQKQEIGSEDSIPKNVVWVDLLEPSIEEEKKIEKAFKIDLPTREEIDKIEVMSPFYKEDDSYFMTLTSISKADREYPEGVAIIFILTKNTLITLRYSKPKAFSFISNRLVRNNKITPSPEVILEALIESILNTLADVLEKTGNELDQLLVDVFEKPSGIRKAGSQKDDITVADGEYYINIIRRIGRAGNLISKIRESLVSMNRMLIFFGQIEDTTLLSKKEQRMYFRNLSREIQSLAEFSNFLAQRNSFLLDATLGMINVEQNMIIKVFTVAAAVFLPPTLIASIYGMNFHNMPELTWDLGYPISLILIVLSAILPYLYFKRKKWL
jgi:magnesium transporter